MLGDSASGQESTPLSSASAPPPPSSEKVWRVRIVEHGTGADLVEVELAPTATLADLRAKVASQHTKEGFEMKLQYSVGGVRLDDDSAVLAKCGVADGASIAVAAPLPQGPQPTFRSLSAGSFGGLGGMIGPNIGKSHSKLGSAADAGTPEYMLLRSGVAISVRSQGVAQPTMIHYGLGTHNLLQLLCTLKCPVHGTSVDVGDAVSLIFYRCRYGIDGMQEPLADAKKDSRTTVKRDGTATGSKYLELDLTSKEQVKWLYCTITCSSV
jgi:hypothetical protein